MTSRRERPDRPDTRDAAAPSPHTPSDATPAPGAPQPAPAAPPAPAAAPAARSQAREILSLAVPAFFTLLAEPAFLLVDTAVIGHLGTSTLAGLAVASTVLLTITGLCVFLAYGSTSAVARKLGAGERAEALSVGVDGMWLAVLVGALLMGALLLVTGPIVDAFGASPDARHAAEVYLKISSFGLAPMLLVLAATGVLRGLQDTVTPLVVTIAGAVLNIGLNLWFVLGLGMGIAGSALGTVIAQTLMAAALATKVLRAALQANAPVHLQPQGVLGAARSGIPLFVRTIALRAVLLLTAWVAAGLGDVPLASYQISMTIWSALAFALDALAIAAQALTGRWLGAGDLAATRTATATMTRWGLWCGVGLGLLVALASPFLPMAFTPDPAVRHALTAALIVVGLSQPISGIAFVLDGVLIGAGDGKWLAGAQTVMFVAYLPAALLVHAFAPASAPWAVVCLWLAFTWFMAVRTGLLTLRARTTAWMR